MIILMSSKTTHYIGHFKDVADLMRPSLQRGDFAVFAGTPWGDTDLVAAIFDDGKPIVFSKLSPNPYAQGRPEFFINFIEVAKDRRHRGLGTQLLGDIFQFASTHPSGKAELLMDGFTPDGKEYLLRQMTKLSEETGVNIVFVPGS
jgi:GNAT superfamily N-acetyltransferase